MSHAFRHLDLFVTESCNLACPYCFARSRSDAREMPASLAHQAIEWLCASRSNRLHVTFWGGEPLLRLRLLQEISEDFVDRARFAGKQASLSLPTNGTLLTPGAFDWIERFGVRTFLSIDGDAETQAGRPLRSGKRSHPLAQQGLARDIERRGRRATRVRMTVTPDNAARLPDNIRYFARQGVDRLMAYPAYDMPWTEDDVKAFAHAERQVADILAGWLQRSRNPRRMVRLDAWMPVLRALAGRGRTRRGGDPVSPCGVGLDLVAFNTDGTFSPCHRFTFYERSKGRTAGRGALPSGPDTGPLRAFEGLTWGRQRGVVPCPECDLYSLCTMGCVAINEASTGDLLRVPDWACALQRARVDACRRLHERCHGHPAYEAYLGQPDERLIRGQADRLGRRAAEIWKTMDQARSET